MIYVKRQTAKIVLMIDEVDSAANNQVLLIFWHSLGHSTWTENFIRDFSR